MAKEMKLLQAAMDGNSAAFEQIVEKYQSLVCAITFSGTGRVDISEELAQETFLSAWKNLRQLKELNGFRPWLCTIARNILNNYYRKKKPLPLDPADIADLSDQAPTPSDNLISQEEHVMLEQALMQIPAEYREPLVMYYRQEKSTKEVALGLGLNESTVRMRLHRARRMLREEIAARLERTLKRTAPDKTFTKAVMLAVGGAAIGISATASTAAITATNAAGTGISMGIAAVMSTVTAKVITAVAVATVVVGAVFVYIHLNQPEQRPGQSYKMAMVQEEQEPITTFEDVKPALPEIQEVVGNPIEAPTVPITEVATITDTKETAQTDSALISQTTEIPDYSEYVFEPNGVLSGLITDVVTGKPVTDAEIHISCGMVYQTRTDKEGFYSFDKIESDGNYDISIHSNEYVGIPLTNDQPVVNLKKDGQVVKHFQFPKACMVDVWVVDEEGNGIKNANIVATSPTDSRQTEINRTGSSKYTDETGYLLLGGFKPAQTEYLIHVWHTYDTKIKREDGSVQHESKYDYSLGNALVKLTDPDVIKSVQIVLKEGTKVQGYAYYSDGNPASDLKIIAGPDWWHCNYGVDGYPVDDNGSFELEHIVSGTYNISAYKCNDDGSGGSSYVVMQAELPLLEGELLYVNVPEKSPESLVSISGTLTYVGKKEPGYVEVSAYSPIHGQKHCNVGYENGKLKTNFSLDRLEPGQYKLTFSGENVSDVVIENVEAPSDGLEVEIVYVDKPKVTFSVLDASSGESLQKFRARVKKLQTLGGSSYVQEDRWYYFSEIVDKHEIEVVGPGTYQIQVAAEDYAPKWSSIINTDMPETAIIELTKGGTLSGKVINEKGEPINGAKVMALSYCGGSKPRTIDVFSNQQDAVETNNGDFIIENLPSGIETLKVVHPDYTFKIIGDIEIVEGQSTPAIQIVLTKGATVEGYVYDINGKPEEGVILFFQDTLAYYGDSGDEDMGRYAIALTDREGFYRASHLPEKMCYVQRKDKWNALGVILRTVIPKNDKVTKLDFGGNQILKGTAVIDGVPLSEVKIQLGSVESPDFGDYSSQTRTDLEGNFIFRGVIEGKYAIYYENTEKRNDWIKLSNVEIGQEDLDVGIIPGDMSELTVTVDQSSFKDDCVISKLYLSDAEKVFGQPLYMSTSKSEEQRQWFFKGVEPGKYLLTILMSDNMQIRQAISLSEFESNWSIAIELPKSTSSVSGTIIGDTSQGIVLWQEGVSVITVIHPDSNCNYQIKLPAGKYVVGSTMSLLNGTEGISQFELHDNEDLKLDINLTEKKPDEMGMLQVQVIDDQGKPRLEVDIQLQKDGKITKPLQSTQIGHIFVTVPGDYVLSVKANGFKSVEKPITLKPIVIGAHTPKIAIVNLEKE